MKKNQRSLFKSCMLLLFIFFCGNEVISQTIYEVEEGEEWISQIANIVTDGDTIMLVTDGGNYYTAGDGMLPAKKLVLMAKPGLINKPVLTTGSASTLLNVNANLTVSGIAFNGSWAELGDNGPYRLLRVNAAFSKLIVENCDFYNTRGYGIVSNSPVLDSLVVNNCTFTGMDKIGIYFKDQAGLVNYAKITSSTFSAITDIGIYILQAADKVEVSNCTFFGLDNINVYPKECVTATIIQNNIFMSDSAMVIKIYGATPVVEYNCFYNNSTDIEYVGDPPLDFPTGNIYEDPLFKNAATGDFTLSSNSPCLGSASDGENMGDPRWGVEDSVSKKIMVTFNVTVPENTPDEDTMYVVGTFNAWLPGELAMIRLSQYLWQYAIELDENTTYEYKYTRGDWETVEKDSSGGEIENRVISTGSADTSVTDEVASWRDIAVPVEPQNVSPILTYFNSSPQTSIAITWASKNYGEFLLYYGINDVNENQVVIQEHKDLIETGDSLIHIARLTDLTPNTTYLYKVETVGIYYSDTYTFTTAAEETEFSFCVGGDNQLALIPEILEAIIAENPRFMIHVGDMVVDGNNVSEWYTFLENFRDLNANYAMMPIYGNHEEDSPSQSKFFQLPSNGASDATNAGHWFSFNYNNVHFIGLDVQRDFEPGSEQYNWLKNDLQSIDENIDHRIIYCHQPPYSSTGYHGPNIHVREYLGPLFIQYGVEIVFSGHNHHYERSMVDGIAYIITGGLGEWLKDFDQNSNPWAVYSEKVNHYCRVSVSGSDIKVEMVREDGSIGDTYESFKVDGNDGDWLSSGINPLLDTDNLQTDTELKLYRFFISQDEDYFYFGFDAPAQHKGVYYGMYIDVDNVPGSGGTSDVWDNAIAAQNEHLPELELYAFHENNDTWNVSSPEYYSWDSSSSDWITASGGMGSLPEGGVFAVDTTNRFFELAIPKDAPGFNGSDSFFVQLFTVGETSGAGASESIPSDSTIQFSVENTSTDVTVLKAFYGFNITVPAPPDSSLIKIDGDPADWLNLQIDPVATDTDNAQQGTEYKMDSLYVYMDSTNVYFGFRTPAENIGLHYGIYIDTDNVSGSGASFDEWACDMTAITQHLPDVAIYAYHNDTGGWSGSSPKYYTWNGSDWENHTGGQGSLPPDGTFTHNAELDFVEIKVPRTSPGFENVSNFYISLFNFGGDKHVCETVPSDPAVTFNGENTSTTIEISSFAYYQNPINTKIESNPSIQPAEFRLYQNYPNPFNPVTRINYSVGKQANVSIKVFDVNGRLVATLAKGTMNAGSHQVIFDGKNLTTGIYFCQFKAGDFRATKKLILVK